MSARFLPFHLRSGPVVSAAPSRFKRQAVAALLLAASIAGAARPGRAQDAANVTALHSFGFPTGRAGLIRGADGSLYGANPSGGTYGHGYLYRVDANGAFATIYVFRGGGDGAAPAAALVLASDGNLYGTTTRGGANNDGTIFRLTPANVLTTLHDFDSPAGGLQSSGPLRPLIQGTDGNFYGTTLLGGPDDYGTIYRMSPQGAFSSLHHFSSGDAGGYEPQAGLVEDAQGNLYGTASGGTGHGSIFRITAAGALTVLHVFQNTEGYPSGQALTRGSDGNFYGTTFGGGSDSGGSVFRMTPAGDVTTLYTFSRTTQGDLDTGLVLGSDGNFYGTLYSGSYDDTGPETIFRLTPTGVLSTLYRFGNTAGAVPQGTLVEGAGGAFYGTTRVGGAHRDGTLFRLASDGTFTSLHDFDGNIDGITPTAAVIQGADGNFYGTADMSALGQPAVFRLTPGGVSTTIGTVDGHGFPLAALLQADDGNFYGTSEFGGDNSAGAIYKVTPAGVLSILYSFYGDENGGNRSRLIADGNGGFLGATSREGINNAGMVYRFVPGSAPVALHNFVAADGTNPWAGVIRSRDGFLYGTTNNGGANNYGTVYRLTDSGALSVIHSFSPAEGESPRAELIEGSDGYFYGTLSYSPPSTHQQTGAVFRVAANGNFAILHTFSGGIDGNTPQGGLLQGSDGNFYGTTQAGGTNGNGTIYRITPDGAFRGLYSFPAFFPLLPTNTGGNPRSALIQGTDGAFYGTASAGGSLGFGTVFRFTLEPAITSAVGATAVQGQPFSYQLAATNSPVSYTASGLPSGLSLNAGTGLISGSAAFSGVYDVTVTATNPYGTATGTLRLTVIDQAPVITGGLNPPCRQGVPFGYQIQATQNPTRYTAVGLPPGLTLNKVTGKITGTPSGFGNYSLAIGAANGGGTGTAALNLLVRQALPVISGELNPPSRQGVAFAYKIMATNAPASYGASGLPAGLVIDRSTGRISGAPAVFGTFGVTLAAFNGGGSGTAQLNLVVKPAAPVITSSLNPPSRQGAAFVYQITAANNPTKYGESGLPAGLTINQTTGKISGTPAKAGTYNVTIAAFNSAGSGSARLTLVVKPPA